MLPSIQDTKYKGSKYCYEYRVRNIKAVLPEKGRTKYKRSSTLNIANEILAQKIK